ncbi:general substrate transporter [Aureobasidium pullulans]|uniref:General substrate transporter n=1 Tax=Aureobasidium pullulans TaxID=5580 RepID=A0A4S9K9A8_AURPU|nr:general substrate transporter [Aureobasidium pullulans]
MGGPAGVVAASGSEVYKSLRNNVNPKWIQDPGLRKLNFGVATMFASAAANGYDGSLINGLLAIPYFNTNLGDPSSSLLGLTLAGISLGGLPSFIPASYVSDYMGRRFTVFIGSFIMLAAAVIQCATSGVYAFLGTRIMLGVGLGFSQTAAPPLTTEIAHPKHRANVTNLFQATWYWGAILSASIALGTLFLDNSWSWRIPCLLQGLFPAIQCLGLLIVPESPRWLISKGRDQEALDILAKYHANGDKDDELVQYEFQEICQAIEMEKQAAKSTGWSTFFATKGNRHRFLICILVGFMIQWAGNGIVSYYLAPILKSVGITSSVTQAGINLALQFWNAGLSFAGALAAERYGRRPLWLLSASGMLVSFIIVTALSATFAEHGIAAAGSATVAFLFIFFGFYDIAFTPLSIAYPVEILPYNLRSKGLSANLTTVFAAGFFNQYVNPIALEAIEWKFYFVYIATLAAMIPTIYFVFPETKGRTLEEISIVFDGEDARTDVFRQNSVSDEKGSEDKEFTANIEYVKQV